jgi:hypothetical protein
MATVTASNGTVYHVWGLSEYTTPSPVDEIEFDTVDVDLGDGYRSGIQTGFDLGNRKWRFSFPTLASLEVLPNTLTDINGASVSREQYVRAIYAENKVTGQPFVLTWNGTNYFVDFEDEALSLQRMKVKIYTTGLTLVQRRLPGVTV